MKRRFQMGMFFLIALALLAAACTPAQTPTTPASTVEVPVTAATATSPATPGPADTTHVPTLAPTAAALPGDQATATATGSGSGSGSTGAGTKYVLDAAKSEASYAVREQLARLNFPTDAVGKTNAVTGAIVVNPDGTIDSANSQFTVDVSTLKSDSSMRDRYVMGNILQTSQYPSVVFVPSAVSGLPATLPQSGNVSFQLTGNLTIRDVTKPVTWDVSGSVTNGVATGTATTSFTFEDFNLNQPRVPVVLSVVDKITLNLTLTLQAASH